jgi:hypothetical protein
MSGLKIHHTKSDHISNSNPAFHACLLNIFNNLEGVRCKMG